MVCVRFTDCSGETLLCGSHVQRKNLQGIWVQVFSRVRETRLPSGFTRLYDHDDEEYYAEIQRKEDERDAQKRETFKMLFRLFGYMAKEWAFYAVAFSFLLLYSLCKCRTDSLPDKTLDFQPVFSLHITQVKS